MHGTLGSVHVDVTAKQQRAATGGYSISMSSSLRVYMIHEGRAATW